MTVTEFSASDAFLRDLDDPVGAALGLADVSSGLATEPADAARLRLSLIEALDPYQRFARFEAAVAEILQLPHAEAAAALRRIDDASAWLPQTPYIAYLPVQSGPEAGYFLTGFLRVDAGCELPEHEHIGEELTYVLQGAFVESSSGKLFRPGEPAIMSGGTRHSLIVPADGPHLLGLVTVRDGIRLVG
jgi:quercetin dioxygenase-like cupin family protein